MKAGRELDALVAEHIMGWNWGDTGYGLEGLFPPNRTEQFIRTLAFDSNGFWGGMPHYSTKIADAWEVVEKMLETKFTIRRQFIKNLQTLISIEIGISTPIAIADDYIFWMKPHHICLAALKAVGVDIERGDTSECE